MKEDNNLQLGIIKLIDSNRYYALKKIKFFDFEMLMNKNLLKKIILNADDKTIEHIIENGYRINCIVNDMRPIAVFCKNGKICHIEMLLNNGATISSRGPNNKSLLHIACEINNFKMIRFLVERGLNIEYASNDGSRAIHYVCRYGNAKVLRYLINQGADINVKDNFNNTPVLIACHRGNVELVKILVNEGARVDCINDKLMSTIYSACIYRMAPERNYTEIVRTLCENKFAYMHGFIFNELHQASRYGKIDIVKILVNYIDINSKGGYQNQTALHFACETGNSRIIEFLISKGADLNITDSRGKNALHIMCERTHLEFSSIRNLINGFDGKYIRNTITRSKIDLFCRDQYGKRPIDYVECKKLFCGIF
jgi:ankyrin repeat protein